MAVRSATMAESMVRHRFSVDDYERMVEVGILGRDDRVELLHGEVVVMAPIGGRHNAAVWRLLDAFAPLRLHALQTAVLTLWQTDISLKASPLPKRLLLENAVIGLCTEMSGHTA